MKVHVQRGVASLPALLLCGLVLVVHQLKLFEHLCDESDLLIETLDLYPVFRRLYVLFVLNNLQVAQLDVLLELVELVVVLFQQAQKLPVIVLCEIEILIPLSQRLLQLHEKLREEVSYKLNLGVEVLEVDVVADLHVLELHLQVLVVFKLLEAIGTLVDGLVAGIAQGRFEEV